MSLNQQLAELFSSLAAIMEIKGESPFKSIAFSKVSRLLKDMTLDIRQAAVDGKLGEIEGIGKSSPSIIDEFVRTGKSKDFEEVAASVPAGLLPLLEIPGLGPKTIALLWKERDITSLEQLVDAIENGKLAGLKGIGEKKIESIKQGIALRQQASGRLGIVEAMEIAEGMLGQLLKVKGVLKAEIAGSLRRRKETIGDVDLVCAVASAKQGPEISEAFVKFPEVIRILGQGPTKASILTASGLQVDLRMVPLENFGAALLYFTGSKEHNVELRSRAQTADMTLNEWGLYRLSEYDKAKKKTGEAPSIDPVASRTEADIYKALNLPMIPPELRQGRGEIIAAEKHALPKLIETKDIRGDLHCHTTASDGQNTIEEMAEAAMARGYQFLAITDHSKSQVIANGLTAERLLKHAAAIRKVGEKLRGITLLAGCEVDILADGSLDFEDSVLAELDIVVASPHVALKQESGKATERLLRAIENRYVTIIGHPTGRLINRRAGLPLEFEKIFTAAARTGTALEINAGYPRLDINDMQARAAIAAGCKLSINTDAHSIDGLAGIGWGINVARRAWACAEDVVNCFSAQELLSFISKKRQG